MEFETTHFKRCDLVKAKGRIDSYTAPKLREVLDKVVESGVFRIVLDMSEVDFLSSSGVWVLLETQKKCKRWNRGQLVIARVHENIQRTLDLAGLRHFFRIFDDVTAAVGAF